MPRRQLQQQQPENPQEQQLSNLLQLAQFANTASEPGIAQQRLEQQDQENRVAAAIHLLGLQQQKDVAAQTARNEDEQRRLQEKQIDEIIKSRVATIKGNVADALLTMGTHNPDSLPLVAGALKKLDFPELSDSASDLHKTNVEQKVAEHLQKYNAARDKPGYLTAIKADPSMTPEVWSGLQEKLPKDTAAPVAPSASGPSAPGYIPGVGLFSKHALTDFPGALADIGAGIANYGYLPLHNLMATALGTDPIQPFPYMKQYPTKDEFAKTSPSWLTNLLYK